MSSTSMTTTARQQMLNTFETFVRGELANICRKLNDLYPDGYFVSDAELEHLTWHLRQHFATMLPPVQDDAPEAGRRPQAQRPNARGDRRSHATIRRNASWVIVSRAADSTCAHSQNASEGPQRWLSVGFRSWRNQLLGAR